MFSVGSWLKIWNVVDKGNYAEVECSTSQKSKMTGNYETDFTSKFVRFVGKAYNARPQKGEKIKITNCGVQNTYERDGQKHFLKNPTFIVFDFERDGASKSYAPSTDGFVEINDNEGLPF